MYRLTVRRSIASAIVKKSSYNISPSLSPIPSSTRLFSSTPLLKMDPPTTMYATNIASTTGSSDVFRRVLWTGVHSQLVIMNVPVGGEIGEEVHHVDQHLSFVSGRGKAIVNGEEREVGEGWLVVVPKGCRHNFVNTGKEPLLLYTVYAPAEHAPTTVHETKDEGDKLEEEGKDEAPKFKES